MIEPKSVEALKTQLFADRSATVFVILDGASVPDLLDHLAKYNPEHVCLYRGELEPDLAEVAPYLSILPYDSPFTDWVIAKGWGEHWGIFGRARADLATLRKHFRKFLMVYDESGKSLYFRYYDPRVLRVYLPTCNGQELKVVFGPVLSYFAEGEQPGSGVGFVFSHDVVQQASFPV